MDVQAWYLKTSKLAMALAIIRSKPPGRNSTEYIEHLAKMLSGQDEEWRSKVAALETEVLQLRQKLLLNKICPGPYIINGNTNVLSSKDLESPENIFSQLEDSGCDVSSENRTDPSELSQNIEENFTPSSEISVYQLPFVKNPCVLQEKTLSSHLQFLQHVLELRNLPESGHLKTDLNKFENDCYTVSDSVFRLLDGLMTFYNDPKIAFSNILTEAVCILTRLIDDCYLSNHILKKCFKKLEEFEKALVQVILRNRTINRVQSRYDVAYYENIFSFSWILEQLLQDGTKDSNNMSNTVPEEEEEIKKFLGQLDKTILRLSDEFPLFTIYIWRVGVLLNSAQITAVENNSPP